ncbi:hypothetical protein M011DRAFT_248048 [Sporormia fimetaria CBS 119925]|uniref:Uncharacterized protein n=1 Tax=Sporormia fimetaria CBS 119925 TaxID=1340428 RepID=A0A6A6UY12_9PLEO|nr:hypothetical protein M011DRAFT_248048 [Sporormia fimetaria CBS 119925]
MKLSPHSQCHDSMWIPSRGRQKRWGPDYQARRPERGEFLCRTPPARLLYHRNPLRDRLQQCGASTPASRLDEPKTGYQCIEVVVSNPSTWTLVAKRIARMDEDKQTGNFSPHPEGLRPREPVGFTTKEPPNQCWKGNTTVDGRRTEHRLGSRARRRSSDGYPPV